MVGNQTADVLEHTALGGTDNVHHVVLRAPLLRGLQYFLKQPLTVCVFHQLEIMTAFVRGQR